MFTLLADSCLCEAYHNFENCQTFRTSDFEGCINAYPRIWYVISLDKIIQFEEETIKLLLEINAFFVLSYIILNAIIYSCIYLEHY